MGLITNHSLTGMILQVGGGWSNPIEKYALRKMGSSNLPQISGMKMKKKCWSCHHLPVVDPVRTFREKSTHRNWEWFRGTYMLRSEKRHPNHWQGERIGSLRVSRLEEKNKSTGGKRLKDSLVGGFNPSEKY